MRISAFFIPNFAFFSCNSAFVTLSDLARIIELRSAQLDRVEIANFAPVSSAMLLNSKEFGSEAQLKSILYCTKPYRVERSAS